MEKFEKIRENLYRIRTAYKDIYTSVYLLTAKSGAILFDAASFDEDMDEVIVPALSHFGVTKETLKYVFISHNHADHAGGLKRFVAHYPNTTIVSRSQKLQEKFAGHPFLFPEEGELLLDTYRVVPIVGHTVDSTGLLDTRNNVLVTGDCLQLHGIIGSGEWASNINFPAEHWQALEKLEKMPCAAIYTAHDYHPYGFSAVGEENVKQYIAACREPLLYIKKLILDQPEADDAAVRARFNEREGLPTVREGVVRAVREAVAKGAF